MFLLRMSLKDQIGLILVWIAFSSHSEHLHVFCSPFMETPARFTDVVGVACLFLTGGALDLIHHRFFSTADALPLA